MSGEVFNVTPHPRLSEGAERLLKRQDGGGTSGGMDDLIRRVGILETDMREVKGTLGRIEPLLARIDERLNHVATKEQLAEKPGKAYMWSILAVLTAVILGSVAVGAALT